MLLFTKSKYLLHLNPSPLPMIPTRTEQRRVSATADKTSFYRQNETSLMSLQYLVVKIVTVVQ